MGPDTADARRTPHGDRAADEDDDADEAEVNVEAETAYGIRNENPSMSPSPPPRTWRNTGAGNEDGNGHNGIRSDRRIISIRLTSYGRKIKGGRGRLNVDDLRAPPFNCERIPNPSSSSRKGRTGLDRRLRTEVMREPMAREIVERALDRIVGDATEAAEAILGETVGAAGARSGCEGGDGEGVAKERTCHESDDENDDVNDEEREVEDEWPLSRDVTKKAEVDDTSSTDNDEGDGEEDEGLASAESSADGAGEGTSTANTTTLCYSFGCAMGKHRSVAVVEELRPLVVSALREWRRVRRRPQSEAEADEFGAGEEEEEEEEEEEDHPVSDEGCNGVELEFEVTAIHLGLQDGTGSGYGGSHHGGRRRGKRGGRCDGGSKRIDGHCFE